MVCILVRGYILICIWHIKKHTSKYFSAQRAVIGTFFYIKKIFFFYKSGENKLRYSIKQVFAQMYGNFTSKVK